MAEFKGSGLTQAKFCELHGVSVNVFRRQLYASRSNKVLGPEGFIRVALEDSIQHLSGVELHFPDGSFIRFTGEVEPNDMLRRKDKLEPVSQFLCCLRELEIVYSELIVRRGFVRRVGSNRAREF
jgi:hypothetical protein